MHDGAPMDARLRSSEVRIGLGLLIVALLAFAVWPGPPQFPEAAVTIEPGGGDAWPVEAASQVSVSPGPVAGATSAPEATTEATPESTPEATPEATPVPTPAPTPEPVTETAGGEVELTLCRSISGSQCEGQTDRIGPDVGSVVALVHLRPANAGDVVGATLSGPGGTVSGGTFQFSNSGTGYYYTTFAVGGLPAGEYTVIATRNGSEVDRAQLVKDG
jgi:hypothetical protein